jgi:hypothetical protein
MQSGRLSTLARLQSFPGVNLLMPPPKPSGVIDDPARLNLVFEVASMALTSNAVTRQSALQILPVFSTSIGLSFIVL